MGMFDRIIMFCPKCSKPLEFQSKSGNCRLENYSAYNVPTIVATGADGDLVSCDGCGETWMFKVPVHVTPILVPKQ